MNLIFMRHGEATNNKEEFFSDKEIYWSILTEKGIKEVKDSINLLPKNIDKIFEPQKSLRNVDFSGFYFVLVAGSSQLSNLFFEDYYSILALAS